MCCRHGRSSYCRHPYICCKSWPLKGLCKQEKRTYKQKGKSELSTKKKKKKKEGGGRKAHTHEFLFFEFRNPPPRAGSSSRSSRISSDSSEDKSASSPRVAEIGMEEGVTTKEEPSFTAWDRAAKGSLVEMTRGVTGVVSIWIAAGGVAPLWTEGVSAGRAVTSLTSPIWVPSSMGTGSVREVEVSKGTPCVTVKMVGIANSAPPKRPSMGMPMGTESSSAVGQYTERGRGSS